MNSILFLVLWAINFAAIIAGLYAEALSRLIVGTSWAMANSTMPFAVLGAITLSAGLSTIQFSGYAASRSRRAQRAAFSLMAMFQILSSITLSVLMLPEKTSSYALVGMACAVVLHQFSMVILLPLIKARFAQE